MKIGSHFAAALYAAALSPPVHAQTPPDAGRLIQDQQRDRPAQPARTLPLPALDAPPRAALQTPTGVRVRVADWRFTRNGAIPEAELASLLADLVGKELELAGLTAAADRITRHYRARGFLVARAYLPAQEITNGTVEITILEGRLGNISIDNRSMVAASAIEPYFADLRKGGAIAGAELERGLLLVDSLPGVDVQSTLRPGASVGTTDLDVRIAGERRLDGGLSIDDYGNRYTGDWRLGGQFAFNSPLARGDALSLRAYASDERYRYGRLAYQSPVGGNGLQLGAAASTMSYRAGEDFADLGAHGKADIASVYALYPVVRSRIANVNVQADFDHKSLDDFVDSALVRSTKRLDVFMLGLSGDLSDELGGGGLNVWSVTYTGGHLAMDSASRELDAAGHGSAGRYDKLNFSASRLQRLAMASDSWTLLVQFSGQLAHKNLDSSEKFAIGGPKGVRAYPQGEAPVDDGWLGSVELRCTFTEAWQLAGFFDAGGGHTNHGALATDLQNSRTLSGAGLSARVTQPGALSIEAALAWRSGPAPTSDRDRSPRLWVNLVKGF